MSRIILSDIHGCYKTMLALVAKLPAGIPLTFAGDLIDRGLNSKDVIEFVKNGGHDCVVGNHEVMMLDELRIDNDEIEVKSYEEGIWLMNGGEKTLDSYDTENGIIKLKEHLEWIKTLPYYIEYPELKDVKGQHLLVTHTTAAEVWGKYESDTKIFKNAVIWERIAVPKKIKDVYSIYGHTPQKNKATIKDHFACIDGGVYLNRKPYGSLFALQFPEMIVYEQENVEDEKT